jgi:hypothetical protein
LADAPAGTAQAAELAVFDAYGNPAAGYQGAVLFTSNDEQASLPALLAFSGAGPFLVQGVVLGTVGSRTVTVTDIANGALTDTQTTTVSPGPTSELRMHLAAQAIAFSVISFGNCGVTPYDAYGNITPAYTGTLFWSSSDAPAQLPVTAQWNPFALLGCVFHTAGDQTVTATDAANGLSVTGAIPVLGPVAHTDQVTVLNPIHPARITKPVFNTLANDSFGVLAVPTITSVSQATFTRDYVTRQLGIASKSPDGKRVILDLFPPEGSTAEAPGMELVRCPPTGDYDMCSIDVPIAMEYTATDGINTTTATVNLTLDGPMYIPFSVDLTLPATPPYSGSAGFVATDAPGFLIPISTPLTVNSITPNTIDPNLTTIVLSGQLCAAGTPGCTDVSRFQTTVTAAMPGDFVISSGQTVSFGQTASLILSSDPNAIEPSSIGIITPPTSTGFENLNAGAILNISDTQFFLGEQLLSKPPAATEFTVPTTVGMALRKAIATIEAAGFRAITCLNPAFLALVTGQDPAEGTKAAGSVVKIFYSGCSF